MEYKENEKVKKLVDALRQKLNFPAVTPGQTPKGEEVIHIKSIEPELNAEWSRNKQTYMNSIKKVIEEHEIEMSLGEDKLSFVGKNKDGSIKVRYAPNLGNVKGVNSHIEIIIKKPTELSKLAELVAKGEISKEHLDFLDEAVKNNYFRVKKDDVEKIRILDDLKAKGFLKMRPYEPKDGEIIYVPSTNISIKDHIKEARRALKERE